MVLLERNVRDLNASLNSTRTERMKMIEAHQTRIKHLQHKFLQDLKAAEKVNNLHTEDECQKKLDETIEQTTSHLKKQFEMVQFN